MVKSNGKLCDYNFVCKLHVNNEADIKKSVILMTFKNEYTKIVVNLSEFYIYIYY